MRSLDMDTVPVNDQRQKLGNVLINIYGETHKIVRFLINTDYKL